MEDSSLPSAQHLSLPPLSVTPVQAAEIEQRSEAPLKKLRKITVFLKFSLLPLKTHLKIVSTKVKNPSHKKDRILEQSF